MPGVLMVEAMFQASMWLIRATDQFANSTVVLREVKSLKFQGFVQPGDSLVVNCEIKSVEGSEVSLKVAGEVDGKTATSGRMVVESYNLAEKFGLDAAIDDFRRYKFRLTFRQLCNQLDGQNMAALSGLIRSPVDS
jgi:3-hydroxyacyl-[acyl-carrier-protein] dehydratase